MIRRSVGELATSLGLEVVGDASVVIHGVADLAHAGPEQLSFVRDLKYRELACRSRAGAMLVAQVLPLQVPQLVSRNVGADFARIAALFHPVANATTHRIDPRAAIDPSAVLDAPAEIGPFAVVGPRSRIGAGTVLHARVTVGAECVVGKDCCLHPGVVLYDRVRVGDRVQVHANAVLGADGFGYAQDGSAYVKVPQIGGLVIGDDVEIGAGTMIDRGAIGDTRIGRGTKIDNLVHIAHNCVIGEDVAIAGLCALAGSTVVGDRSQLAGHVVTGGHMRIGDDVRIGGNSAVAVDVLEPGDHMGYPVMRKGRWLRTLGWIARATKPRPGREQQPPASQDA